MNHTLSIRMGAVTNPSGLSKADRDRRIEFSELMTQINCGTSTHEKHLSH